jgi:hypothetical protein
MSARTSSILGTVLALALLVGAQGVREVATSERSRWPKVSDTPYAPSAAAAPYVTLGYRELAADLLWVRLRAYFGGDKSTAAGVRGLVDAIVAVDPQFEPAYEFAGRAISWVQGGPTLDDRLWSIGVLERGIEQFPASWKLAKLAGETYLVDLETDDPAQKTAWKTRGVELLDRAIHMPGAPRNLGTLVAYVRTELGQQERAVEGLMELIRTTDDVHTRESLINRLAEIQGASADRIFAEELRMKEIFDERHRRALPEASAEMYLLLGDPPKPYIDFADLVAEDEVLIPEDALDRVTD